MGVKKKDGKKGHGSAAAPDALDIDSLFAGIKRKKVDAVAPVNEAAGRRRAEQAGVRKLEEVGRIANRLRAPDSPTPLRFDQSAGMNIYSADSLRIGQGKGDTKECPFDCACCY